MSSVTFRLHSTNQTREPSDMLSLKLLRQTLTDPLLLLPHHRHPTTAADPHATPPQPQSSSSNPRSDRTLAVLVFTPTNEVVVNTCRLASIAREIGLNLNPTPSLSHIVFSASSADLSTTSFSSYMCLNDAVPLPFPSLSSASVFHLQAFASITHGYFKLVPICRRTNSLDAEPLSNWERSGMTLVSTRSRVKIETMDRFSRAMAGAGWTLFKTTSESNSSTSVCKGSVVYLYRKVEANRLRIEGGVGRRVREVRLPLLDFKNAPLRILQYIILMTDDVFYLVS